MGNDGKKVDFDINIVMIIVSVPFGIFGYIVNHGLNRGIALAREYHYLAFLLPLSVFTICYFGIRYYVNLTGTFMDYGGRPNKTYPDRVYSMMLDFIKPIMDKFFMVGQVDDPTDDTVDKNVDGDDEADE